MDDSSLLDTPSDQPDQTEYGGSAPVVQLVNLAGVTDLPIVVIDDEPLVLFARAMARLGLNPEAQLRTLRQREWAQISTVRVASPGEGQTRRVVVVSEETFIGHCFQVRSASVAVDRRSVLLAFQRESVRALASYWMRGIAVNPRGRTAAEVTLVEDFARVGVQDMTGDFHAAHYYFSIWRGRRDGADGGRPTSAERAAALDRGMRRFDRGYARGIGPALRAAHLDGIAAPDPEL